MGDLKDRTIVYVLGAPGYGHLQSLCHMLSLLRILNKFALAVPGLAKVLNATRYRRSMAGSISQLATCYVPRWRQALNRYCLQQLVTAVRQSIVTAP